MTQLDPQISLENPNNEAHVTYMKTVASQTDFDYPDVSDCSSESNRDCTYLY